MSVDVELSQYCLGGDIIITSYDILNELAYFL